MDFDVSLKEVMDAKSTKLLKDLVEVLLESEAILVSDKKHPAFQKRRDSERIHIVLSTARKHLQSMGKIP